MVVRMLPTGATTPKKKKSTVGAVLKLRRKRTKALLDAVPSPAPAIEKKKPRQPKKSHPALQDGDAAMSAATATAVAAAVDAGGSSDEEKKEKNRNSVRRSYYRKLETLGELRVHADDLRQQYNEMLRCWERRFRPDAADKSELLLRYMELSRLRDELWTENQQLQDTFEEREKSAFRLQRLFDVNYQLMDHSAHASSRNPETVRFPSPVLIMDEMSREAFHGFALDALSQVESFLAKTEEMTSTHQVLGWKSSHIVEEDSFRFYFEKRFAAGACSVRGAAQQAWEILTSPQRHSELYARTLHVRFHVMQVFDSDSYVLYRTMEKEGEDSITTALIVMTRVPRGPNGGYLVVCKGLKKAEHKLHMESMTEYTLHKKKIWRESMYWLSVDEEQPPEDASAAAFFKPERAGSRLRVAHGGIMKNMGDRSPSFWLFENLLIALRWESKLGLDNKEPAAVAGAAL
ncbi:hypothetical protein PybrP1_006777 [[Pythium] brassicae (nom. inval.)]|nr:hypothetical protein PybrP1_006777 [[Pythium] brassicae (nom. inval.)]